MYICINLNNSETIIFFNRFCKFFIRESDECLIKTCCASSVEMKTLPSGGLALSVSEEFFSGGAATKLENVIYLSDYFIGRGVVGLEIVILERC